MITLYHGSNVKIEEIDLKQCHPYKDFGQAFYLTTVREQAMEIANARVGLQIRNRRLGNIDRQEYLRRLKYMKGITFQYAFCTQRAIEKLLSYECE